MSMSKGRNSIYSFDEWEIKENKFDIGTNYRNETIFTTANGYMGMRGNLEEGYGGPRGTTVNATYINGFYEEYDIIHPEDGYGFARYGQAMVKVPEAKPISLKVNGERLDILKGEVHDYKRTLDMKKGVVEREFTWKSPGGNIAHIRIKRLVCFERPHLAAISFEVRPINFDGRLDFVSAIDGGISNSSNNGGDMRVGAGVEGKVFTASSLSVRDTLGCMMQKTRRSGLSVACAAEHDTSDIPHEVFAEKTEDAIRFKISLDAKKGMEYTLFKYISYYTSKDMDQKNLMEFAAKEVARAKQNGMQVLEREQRGNLSKFWEDADIVIEGDPASQQAIRFSIYSLLSSAGRDARTNIASKGLTGEGYGGHYFWDSDIYMLPSSYLPGPKSQKTAHAALQPAWFRKKKSAGYGARGCHVPMEDHRWPGMFGFLSGRHGPVPHKCRHRPGSEEVCGGHR